MHRKAKLIFSIGVMAIALTGCQSHQAQGRCPAERVRPPLQLSFKKTAQRNI